MTPFAVKDGAISSENIALLKKMTELLEKLPDNTVDEEISCHHVCHALARMFGLEVADGRFGKLCTHSWIVLRRFNFESDGRRGEVIADLYPIAGATPFLVFAHHFTPWSELYVPDEKAAASALAAPSFEPCVESIIAALTPHAG